MTYKGWILSGAAGLATAGLALAGVALAQQGGPQRTAEYWMTAETSSGMAALMGQGGGARSMIGAMMGRGGGNRNGFVHALHLQLGGGRAAGSAAAEHLPPAGLQAGASLPLVTPQTAPSAAKGPTNWPSNMERPRGRILIYWGCGEHARAGQPVVLDFAAMSAGRMPPGFAGASFRPQNPPSPDRFATYGEWPNEHSEARVPSAGSLVGEHVVRGNYTPEIRFTLAPGQDFLAPVNLTSNQPAATGSVPLVWQPVSGARAWSLSVMGAARNGDMILWSSSETQAFMLALDYLPADEIARMIQQRVLLPGTADRCTVPSEVAQGGQGAMLTVTALGGETNISHPLRPARAAASWRPEWTMKLRAKSSYMGMLGVSMPTGADDRGGGQGDGQGEQPKKKKKSLLKKGLGGILSY
jgi:hypothetical protein